MYMIMYAQSSLKNLEELPLLMNQYMERKADIITDSLFN